MFLVEDAVDIRYIKENLNDLWAGTIFEGYRYLDNKQKGEFGERYVERGMKKNHDIQPSKYNNAGHDRIIDKIPTEIKFSLAHSDHKKGIIKDNCWTMNHVAEGKDWERLIFVGINSDPKNPVIKWMTKNDFISLKSKYFNPQQGGNSADNDDWMTASRKLFELTKEMRDISEW